MRLLLALVVVLTACGGKQLVGAEAWNQQTADSKCRELNQNYVALWVSKSVKGQLFLQCGCLCDSTDPAACSSLETTCGRIDGGVQEDGGAHWTTAPVCVEKLGISWDGCGQILPQP